MSKAQVWLTINVGETQYGCCRGCIPNTCHKGHLEKERREESCSWHLGSQFVGCDLNTVLRLIPANCRWNPLTEAALNLVILTPPPPRPSFRLGEPTFLCRLLPFTEIPTRLPPPRCAVHKVFSTHKTSRLRRRISEARENIHRLSRTVSWTPPPATVSHRASNFRENTQSFFS